MNHRQSQTMTLLRYCLLALSLGLVAHDAARAQEINISTRKLTDKVNPFIGTANYGTTNPGAVLPHGLMSVSPFNVSGSTENRFDKDARWWSTPYSADNEYCIGFSHVNLSGVGCPELGGLLLMATTGKFTPDYRLYGSPLTQEYARPGEYRTVLERYGIAAASTVTLRTSLTAFTFPAGEGHILLNLGQALSNESGATLHFVNDSTMVGSRLMGSFCYNPQAVFRQYFAMRVSRRPHTAGYWKKQPPMTVEAQWDATADSYKLYDRYRQEMSGDDVGVRFSYRCEEGEILYVQMGVSFVSEANALQNLEAEQADLLKESRGDYAQAYTAMLSQAVDTWEKALGVVQVEGGTQNEQTIFYTALYHMLIHPNILQDSNGEYPMMGGSGIGRTEHDRYTVFSLWDTYRNVHPLLCLLFPDKQEQMVRSMLDMYREGGWLPRWELYGQETLTMEGDPALIAINDTWQRGVRGFDTDVAYEAMKKSATTAGADNLIRPDNDDYLSLGFVPLHEAYDNSVSHALEYYLADWNLSEFARALGRHEDAALFRKRSFGYRHYYNKEYGMLRPLLPDGSFLMPFDPKLGENFEPNPGFHEGSAYNYSFFVPHDVAGLSRLMGGRKAFVDRLQRIFDDGHYDPTNEPDIAYPYLFSYFPDEAWRTQKLTRELIYRHFRNAVDGLPGNDDAGTMSAWLVYSMLGFYPDCPGSPSYTLTSPVFPKVTIRLDRRYYPQGQLVITTTSQSDAAKCIYIKDVHVGGRKITQGRRRISHDELVGCGELHFDLGVRP